MPVVYEEKMRILCLHGGGTSATEHARQILQTQLAPVIYELAKTVRLEFQFVNGPNEAPAATGIGELYEGPYYRFFDSGAPHITQITGALESVLRQARSPEEYGRSLRESGLSDVESSEACDFVQRYVDQHDGTPFQGVLGFSEGASVAASLILRQYRVKGTSPFKFAIFICGILPLRSVTEDNILADEADETAERIEVPTAHIVGSKDPGYQGSRALYKLCDPSSASIFDHGGAHTIPWDLASTQGIATEIRSVVERFQSVSTT